MDKVEFDKINSYLYWGYTPTREDKDFFDISPVEVDNPETSKAAELLAQEISNHSNGSEHIVPMSGGLDSRLILCELLRSVSTEKIILFTFGIPGSYDYEIPAMIAKKLGIRIERVNLNQVPITTEYLVDSLAPSNLWTYLLDTYYNGLAFKYFGKNATYWSGFMGNNLAGEHLSWYDGKSWEKACTEYILHERICKTNQLFSPDYNPRLSIKENPDRTIVPYIDQLDFRHRQPKCIFPILCAPSSEYVQLFPITSKPFMNYMMGLPSNERKGEIFYRKLVRERTSILENIPVKRTYCLPLKYEGTFRSKFKRYYVNGMRLFTGRPSPMLNYFDFNAVFRQRDDFKDLITSNLADLNNRKILEWLNINDIKRDFFEFNKPIQEAIKTLVSLELYLKYENQ